ncbi:8-oxo-dGTP diphosphatase MutT [Vibrio sp. SCSIO 43136]|uniref:8-oxo-dGTP diphosphatase MutT n=1 Tax=Vibrio sp. SCSIO 43136 TaxID=2819101 RepID=UPI002075DC2A|nr:8-oxo-dGTP diphosphatase MutT [Vibrio sp. SCSIO 43136]USD64860.1 8-oxo-dGTP diphosphatase MutT [Vibrio sp. SCSIO 43136]
MERIHISAAVILDSAKQNVFIAKRPAKKHKAGFWEFPGGGVESGETAEQASIRELHEEVGIEVQEITSLISLNHDYPDKSLAFDFFVVTQFAGEPHGKEGQEAKWIALDELEEYEFPEANAPVIKELFEWVKD